MDPLTFTWWQRWDVWSFTKTLPFLGVVCKYYLCFLVLMSSSLSCRLAFDPPSEPAPRSEKEAAADETPDRHNVEGADSDVRGWEGHPSYPLSPRECEPLMLTRVPIVSLFLELGLFAPGGLMMTVNVMASNRHLR